VNLSYNKSVKFFLIKTLANPTMSKKEYDWNLGEPPPRIKPRKKYCCLMVNCFFLVSLIVFSVALTVSIILIGDPLWR
jgi:hypothetical protein